MSQIDKEYSDKVIQKNKSGLNSVQKELSHIKSPAVAMAKLEFVENENDLEIYNLNAQ